MKKNKVLVIFEDGHVDEYNKSSSVGRKPDVSFKVKNLGEFLSYLADYDEPTVYVGCYADRWHNR